MLCCHQASEAAVPVAIGIVIDRAVATGDLGAMGWSVAGLAVLFTVIAMCWRFGSRLMVAATVREAHELRVELTRRTLDPHGMKDEPRSGELLSIASSDAGHTAEVIEGGSLGIAALCGLTVSSIALLAIDVPLGVGVLIGVPVLVGGLQLLSPVLTGRSADQQATAARATAVATDLAGGLRALRGIGAQAEAGRRYRSASQHALSAALRAAGTTGLYQGLTVAFSGLFLAAIAGVAGWFALSGRLTVGELIAVVGLAQFIAEPLRMLGFCGQSIATARASAGRVAAILGAPPRLEPGSRTTSGPAETRIELSGVSYRTLRGLDLRVGAGEVVGVLAEDQRDSQALLALLAGEVPAEDYTGRFTVDGVPAAELDLAALRRTVLVEPHDVALFAGTLRSNLAVAGDDLDDATLVAALHDAAADDLLASRTAGLDREVTDRGLSMSGGQRQRIAIGRALLASPPVLVLHEPTSAVDAVTEQRLADRLIRTRTAGAEDAATVLVTGSSALLGRADRVVVVRDGQLAGAGSHDQLAESDVAYREAVLR